MPRRTVASNRIQAVFGQHKRRPKPRVLPDEQERVFERAHVFSMDRRRGRKVKVTLPEVKI